MALGAARVARARPAKEDGAWKAEAEARVQARTAATCPWMRVG